MTPREVLPEVVVYRTRYCGYCVMAARLLTSQKIPFREIDVSGDTERRRWLARVTGRQTVPQIFVGEHSIGGYTELAAALRAGPAGLAQLAAGRSAADGS